LDVSSCDAYPCFTYKIMAQYGGLKASLNDVQWKYYKPEEAPEQHLIREPLQGPNGDPIYCGEKLTWYEESWSAKDSGAFTTAVDAYYTMIYNYLENGEPMEIMPYQVRQQMAVADLAHKQNPLPTID
ncbi:MAG: gfo/Idh/MocA family oxidoreductase, partial [Clostridia bacterium]|nr:gfo/Idh/MocA family oxidoreductase [Clostridia bacterium]